MMALAGASESSAVTGSAPAFELYAMWIGPSNFSTSSSVNSSCSQTKPNQTKPNHIRLLFLALISNLARVRETNLHVLGGMASTGSHQLADESPVRQIHSSGSVSKDSIASHLLTLLRNLPSMSSSVSTTSMGRGRPSPSSHWSMLERACSSEIAFNPISTYFASSHRVLHACRISSLSGAVSCLRSPVQSPSGAFGSPFARVYSSCSRGWFKVLSVERFVSSA